MKKTYIILIGLAVILMAVVTVFLSRDGGAPQKATSTPTGIFPTQEATSTIGNLPRTNNTEFPNGSDAQIPTYVSKRLKPITKVAVAGFVSFEMPKSTTTALRYVERETGHVYNYTKSSGALRISNTTIPGIQEAKWSPSGQYVALRYFEGKENIIKTFVANLTESTTTIRGKYIDDDITSIIVAPKERTAGERFLAVIVSGEEASGEVIFDSVAFDGTRRSRLIKLPVPEWLVEWPSSGILYFTTAPSGEAAGYTYLYDLARGATLGGDGFSRILGPLNGLVAKGSTDGTTVLFSIFTNDKVATKLYNAKTQTQLTLGIATIADKCVFGTKKMAYCAVPFFLPTGTYPDDWYKGNVSFSDVIWQIDTETGAGSVVVYPEQEIGISIDAIELAVDSAETTLYFKDKRTGVLWELSLQ